MSKAGHAKKRAKAKVAKLAIAAPPKGSMGGDTFRQWAALLKAGLHAGVNSLAVAQALHDIEQAALAADAHPVVPTPAEKTEAADGKEDGADILD